MRLPILFSLVTTAVFAAQPALRDGEELRYRVGWGLFFHAGEIQISAQNAAAAAAGGAPQLRVTTTTETKGFARALYTFEGRAEALFDAKTGRLLTNDETTKAPNKETKSAVTFDYAKTTATYVNTFDSKKDTSLTLPPGDPLDLIMSLVQTRTWDLKPGEQRDALVLFDDEFYELTIHAVGYEEVQTSLGDFNTLVLEPRMEKTPPKGMFKRGSTVRVWISQDERKLPVKFQVEFKFGAGVATLMHYQPPTQAGGTEGKPAVAEAKPDEKNPRS